MRVKSSGFGPGVGKYPVPGQRKICKCPTPGTVKAGKCPAVAWGGECWGWAQLELTDAFSLCFKSASRCLLFSKMNSRQENRSRLSFTGRSITKYFFERFLSICGEKMFKGFLKFCKLMSNLKLGQITVSNPTNLRKPNSRINYARLH